jgi:3-phosphoshikimate 1-carboxyvinyltransferase
MSKVTDWHPTGIVNGTVTLPTSKSISNRVLLLNAVSGGKTLLQNLSDATDTLLMQDALISQSHLRMRYQLAKK